MENDFDRNLLARIKEDPLQFGILFDLHYPGIFNYVFRRVGDYDQARDICSETFLKAFLHINGFKWKEIPLSFWLYRIAGNELMQYYRKEKYTPDSLDRLIDGWEEARIGSTEQDFLRSRLEEEQRQNAEFVRIQQLLKKLPVKYQEVIALRYFQQKSIKEIALIVDKRQGTVKSLLSRGIRMLKGCL